jgi:hypothetical protein
MSEFPESFTNISCVKDVNLDNVNAGDDVTFASLLSDYALVDDSVSRGRGVALTTTTNTGTGSTNLCVADVTWFPDPKPGESVDWGAPESVNSQERIKRTSLEKETSPTRTRQSPLRPPAA